MEPEEDKERDIVEELDGDNEIEDEVVAGVNSAISDSPAFWNSVKTSVEKAEKVNAAANSFAKELASFYSSGLKGVF